MLALLGNLGPYETLMIALVIVLVFGGRLPEVARDAMKAFYKARRALDDLRRESNLGREFREIQRDIERSIDEEERAARQTPPAPPLPEPPRPAEPDGEDEDRGASQRDSA